MEQITSRQNPLMSHIRKLNTSRSYRRSQGIFVGEGMKLLDEALRWQANVQTVVCAKGTEVPALPPQVRLVEVPGDLLKSIADTDSPQGLLFLCGIPEMALPQQMAEGTYMVLDGVQDPGNVGTIWRTADAFGGAGLILVNNCADPWSPKTVRSTMGACFRLPLWTATLPELKDKLGDMPLYATALRADTEDVRAQNLNRCALVVGSEGRGVSEETLSLCNKTLIIPMVDRCESLNAAVAGSVLLWEAWRQRGI